MGAVEAALKLVSGTVVDKFAVLVGAIVQMLPTAQLPIALDRIIFNRKRWVRERQSHRIVIAGGNIRGRRDVCDVCLQLASVRRSSIRKTMRRFPAKASLQ